MRIGGDRLIFYPLIFVLFFFAACGGGKHTKHQATEEKLICSNAYAASDFQPCMSYDKYKHVGCDESIEGWRVECVEDCVETLYRKLGSNAGCQGADGCVDVCLADNAPDCRAMYDLGGFVECSTSSYFDYYDYALWVCFPGLPGDERECAESCFAYGLTDCALIWQCADSCTQ